MLFNSLVDRYLKSIIKVFNIMFNVREHDF